MTRGETRIRQVLVAFGPSQIPHDALEAAAELASALDAEVRALMVEERWLEQVVDHPVAAELCIGSRTVRPWNRDVLRLELRARAEQVRRAVRRLAESRGVRFSFEVTRGEVGTVLETAGGAGVLTAFIAGSRSSFPAIERSRIELTQVLRRSRGFTLVHREGRIQRLPILVYYSGSPSARRALGVIGALRRGRREEVRVLFPPADEETSLRLLGEVEAWRREGALRVVTQQLASSRPSDLARTLLQFRHYLIVLPAPAPVLRRDIVESVLDHASAVLVVRA
ncbi:MAG TPA: hypothetical protein VMS86_13695 [Thermoanaerobaculia bacterium]|nr:hypothetical protein [Thermoanaerobaculia bacterium]